MINRTEMIESIDKARLLHDKLLEIAIYFDYLCKENNIEYYLSGGAALGAKRHNGFIPWDDDLDVFMTHYNYYKFVRICSNQLDTKRFYLQKENTKEWPLFFSKLRMNGTTYIEQYNESIDMHKGIFIDIYRLDNLSSNYCYRLVQFYSSKILIARSLNRINYIPKKYIVKLFIQIVRYFPKTLDNLLFNLLKRPNMKNSVNVTNFFHRGSIQSNTYPIKWLGKGKYVRFEHVNLPVPENNEAYLNKRFNCNLEIPVIEHRKVFPHVIYFDPFNDYKEYYKANKQ